MTQPLYRDEQHIVTAHSVWQHTGHGALWSVLAVVDGTVQVESMDRRTSAEFPVGELLRDYVEI